MQRAHIERQLTASIGIPVPPDLINRCSSSSAWLIKIASLNSPSSENELSESSDASWTCDLS